MKRNSPSNDTTVSHNLVLSAAVLEKALAAGGLPAAGEMAVNDLPRLAQSVQQVLAPVQWRLDPDAQAPGLGRPRRRWWLSVKAELQCQCERCLEPVALQVSARRGFEFFESAAVADAQSAQTTADDTLDDPALAAVDFLSPEDGATLQSLVEDEVLLNLPLAPKHADCKAPGMLGAAGASGPAQAPDSPAEPPTTRPFAGLKELLKKP